MTSNHLPPSTAAWLRQIIRARFVLRVISELWKSKLLSRWRTCKITERRNEDGGSLTPALFGFLHQSQQKGPTASQSLHAGEAVKCHSEVMMGKKSNVLQVTASPHGILNKSVFSGSLITAVGYSGSGSWGCNPAEITTQRSCYELNYNLLMTTETRPDIKLHPADCLNAPHTA